MRKIHLCFLVPFILVGCATKTLDETSAEENGGEVVETAMALGAEFSDEEALATPDAEIEFEGVRWRLNYCRMSNVSNCEAAETEFGRGPFGIRCVAQAGIVVPGRDRHGPLWVDHYVNGQHVGRSQTVNSAYTNAAGELVSHSNGRFRCVQGNRGPTCMRTQMCVYTPY